MNVACDNSLGLLESPTLEMSKDHCMHGILIGRTLIDLQKTPVPLRVMNVTQKIMRISRDSTLACCSPVIDIPTPQVEKDPSDSALTGIPFPVRETPADELPPHCEKSMEGLSDSQSKTLRLLLCEFSELFSSGSHDLGCTDLINHEIYTKGMQKLYASHQGGCPWQREKKLKKLSSRWKGKE